MNTAGQGKSRVRPSFWWCTCWTMTTTTGLLKRTQKFIAGNSKFDMNFIYLHVNRICVTPKTFEREIYEQQSRSQSPSKLATVKRSDGECNVDRDLDPEPRAQPEGRRLWARWRLNEHVRQLRAFFFFLSSSPGYVWMSRHGWAFCLFYVLCFVFVVLLFCSCCCYCCCCLLFFVWTHFIVGHGTFLRHSFIIRNVVGYRQATLVMLAWLPGCSTGPSPLSGSPTLPCVLLAIMPKIWLTSRLLLFIMIHFARFYGCPVPNAVAQWSLQVNEAFNFYSRSAEG